MKRTFSDHEIEALLIEVGCVPKKLELATAYLKVNGLMTIEDYLAILRTLKATG